MNYFNHFSTALVAFMITGTYIHGNSDLSVNKFEKKKFLADSLSMTGAPKSVECIFC